MSPDGEATLRAGVAARLEAVRLGVMGEPDVHGADRVPLDKPRAPSAQERLLLKHLADAPLAGPGLQAQIDAAQVVAECSCGCPSVWLEVDASVPSVSSDSKTGHVALTARHIGAHTGFPEVTLHLVHGRLFELEVWAGYGVRPTIDLAQLEYV
jgi:hypothetical protein